MRVIHCCGLTTVFLSLVCCPATSADKPLGDPRAPFDLFAIDVPRLIAPFDESHIVSDPAIIEASFHQMDTTPHLAVPNDCEAYYLEPEHRNNALQGYRIIGRKPAGKRISGSIFIGRRHPDTPSRSVLAKFDFEVDAVPTEKPEPDDFHRAKGRHFQRLWSEEMAGSAMFRHLAMESLAIPLNALTRQVGAGLIDEVAITGSDPYFRTGTDLAILMQTHQPAILHPSILAQVKMMMRTTAEGMEVMARVNFASGVRRANRIAWSNLPILNHLRGRYPDRDPAKVDERLFGEQLFEPAGGRYVWSEERGTFVSTLHGYHLEPKAGPSPPAILSPGEEIQTKLSFQDEGLRALLEIGLPADATE
ncbi:hypothetical protein [Novipirellula artificiosorum]|uniref:Uncharacterized protein n=1 Tax=Novipirellula artificiosorum TaxID=2528016 RepID=A0A5C6DQE7_9BACT|nr:hypothetical protein [Novipirellula artificiosorum]TWU38394.1 hypothetical protein Poly41_28700 [Novipirellula artificiosorum]